MVQVVQLLLAWQTGQCWTTSSWTKSSWSGKKRQGKQTKPGAPNKTSPSKLTCSILQIRDGLGAVTAQSSTWHEDICSWAMVAHV
jgi:hypothetical protein